MLNISEIDVFRGETQVLWDISLRVHKGERVSILGSNGAGKSSLLAAVTGALPSQNGTIKFKNESLAGQKTHGIARKGIALVPEGRRVYKDMSVRENLEMGAYPSGNRKRPGKVMEDISQVGRTIRPGGGNPFRRGAADAGHWPGFDEQPRTSAH